MKVEQNMSSKIRILPTVLAYFDCQGLSHLQDTFARLFLLLWYLANKEMSQKPSDKKLRLYLKTKMKQVLKNKLYVVVFLNFLGT